jgi:hypothetical protein
MVMAFVMGIFLPLAETVRRIHQIIAFQDFFRWFDDYCLGGVLLLAGLSVKKKKENSKEYLIAAWGIASGGLLLSLFGQLSDYSANISDAGIFNSGFVLTAKILILTFMFVGLYKSIKTN